MCVSKLCVGYHVHVDVTCIIIPEWSTKTRRNTSEPLLIFNDAEHKYSLKLITTHSIGLWVTRGRNSLNTEHLQPKQKEIASHVCQTSRVASYTLSPAATCLFMVQSASCGRWGDESGLPGHCLSALISRLQVAMWVNMSQRTLEPVTCGLIEVLSCFSISHLHCIHTVWRLFLCKETEAPEGKTFMMNRNDKALQTGSYINTTLLPSGYLMDGK